MAQTFETDNGAMFPIVLNHLMNRSLLGERRDLERLLTSTNNCDGLHTGTQAALTTRIGTVHDDLMNDVCQTGWHTQEC